MACRLREALSTEGILRTWNFHPLRTAPGRASCTGLRMSGRGAVTQTPADVKGKYSLQEIGTHTHKHPCTHGCTLAHTCMHIRVHTYMLTLTCTWMYKHILINMCTHGCTHTDAHMHTWMCKHTHTYTMHMYIHTCYIYTHAQHGCTHRDRNILPSSSFLSKIIHISLSFMQSVI